MSWYWPIEPEYKDIAAAVNLPLDDLDDWGCESWWSFYQEAKSRLGKQKAMGITRAESERVGAWADLHDCKYNCAWASKMKNEGFEVGWLVSDLYCAGSDIAEGVGDVAGDVKETASNVTGTISSLTKPKFLIAAGLVAGIVYYNSND